MRISIGLSSEMLCKYGDEVWNSVKVMVKAPGKTLDNYEF